MAFLTRRTHASARSKRERGSVYIEAIFALPVLVLMLFGLVDFSNVMREWLIANNTARAMVRQASLSAGATCNPNAQQSSAVQVGSTLMDSNNIPAGRRSLSVDHTAVGRTLCQNGLLVATVRVQSPLSFLDRLNGLLPLQPIPLTATATVQNENVN
jgi:Flp pilus assembly protein TadG